MQTTTIGEIVKGNVPADGRFILYVICLDDIVLYVGQSSRCAVRRLLDHWNAGMAGQAIDQALQVSGAERFNVWLYSAEDFVSYAYRGLSLRDIERKLIFDLSPAFNRQHQKREPSINMARWLTVYQDWIPTHFRRWR